MKRKTLLLSVTALSLLTGFAATSCKIVDAEGSVTEDITFNGTKTIEVGQTTTILINVANTTSDATVNVTTSDANIVKFADGASTKGITSVKIEGVAAGAATIRATSVETGDYAEVEITVTASRKTAAQVLKEYAAMTNYTFVGMPEDEANRTDKNTSYLKRTSNGFTLTDKAGDAIWMVEDNDAQYGYDSRFGIGLSSAGDYKGFGVYLDKPINSYDSSSQTLSLGALKKEQQLISDDVCGFLSEENFTGLGASATTPSTGFFTTLANINYQWMSQDKDYSNVYTINGTSTDYEAAFLECVIWNLVDPSGMLNVMRAKSVYTYATAASWITTTITVNADESLTFKVVPNDGLKAKASSESDAYAYDTTYIGQVQDIGTTELDSEFKTALASSVEGTGISATLPDVASDITNAREALLGNDYHQDFIVYEGKTTTIDFDIYYTKNYIFYDIDEEYNENYKTVAGEYPNDGEKYYPYALVAESDGYLHQVDMDFDYKITSDEILTNSQGTNIPVEYESSGSKINTLYLNGGYYEYSAFELMGGYYYLSSTASVVWNNDSKTYYSSQYSGVGGLFLYDYFASAYLNKGYTTDSNGIPVMDNNMTITSQNTTYYVKTLVSGVHVENGTSGVDGVTFMLGMGVSSKKSSTSADEGYFVDSRTFDSFGTATTNPVHSVLSPLSATESGN